MPEVQETSEDQIKKMVKDISQEAHDELALSIPGLKLEEDLGKGSISNVWREDPVSFERFVNDPYHMNQPRLSYRQNKAVKEFLGEDPRRILVNPETTYRIAVLLWGKGGGKDWVCSLLQAYIVYLLLCMYDPRAVLGLAPAEAIDILNVAYSASQANEVYFTKFLNRVYNWEWLKDRYLIVDRGRVLNADQHPSIKSSRAERNFVRIGQSFVEFPGMIRAISEHSQSESYEGYNILFWIMDEAAAFKDRGKKANANDVFSTLRTSAHSRFPKVNRGMLISYPRAEDDFMMISYHKAVKEMQQPNPVMYADKGSTWEINPTKFKEDFASEFRLDKRDAEKKYCCNPPATEGAVLSPEAVDALLVERKPLFTVSTSRMQQSLVDPTTNEMVTKEFIGKVLTHINISTLTEKAIPRVFHVDAGLTICPAAMVVAHGRPMLVRLPNNVGAWEEQVINKVIVDQVVVWMPDKERGLQVSINNIASVIQELANHCNIVRGSYDNWNSQSSIEALMAKGIYTEKHDINASDFSELESLVNLQAIDIPYHENVEWEMLTQLGLKKMIQIGSANVLKFGVGQNGYKDPLDALAGVCRLLNNTAARSQSSSAYAPRLRMGAPVASQSTDGINPFARGAGRLPNKVVDRAREDVPGQAIQGNINRTRNDAASHSLLQPLPGATGEYSLGHTVPVNSRTVRPPKVRVVKR